MSATASAEIGKVGNAAANPVNVSVSFTTITVRQYVDCRDYFLLF